MTDSSLNIAWASGVLEGEGCFSLYKRKDNSRTQISIHLEMTDEDIVRRVSDVFKVGRVNKRENTTGRADKRPRKVSWIWSVQSKPEVIEVINKVLPFLGERRKAKCRELLNCA